MGPKKGQTVEKNLQILPLWRAKNSGRFNKEDKMAKIKGIAHMGIAVENVDKVAPVFEDYFGGSVVYKRELPDKKQISTMFAMGKGNLELMEQTDDNAAVAKYLKSRGQGVHHISLEMEGLPELITELEKEGAPVIGKSREGKIKIAFLHPKNTFGILFELTEKRLAP
jgi:methylmalonyl-CoA/ethylmalonyl-CoA epimerase